MTLIKQLYSQSFKDLENGFIAIVMKLLSWVCFASIGFVAIAVIYKAINGHQF